MKLEGCLLTLIGFLAGGTVVAIVNHISAYDRPYLDRNQATPIAVKEAQEACVMFRRNKATDCSNMRLISVREENDGWHFVFSSRDDRQAQGIWVGRLGEVDDDTV